MKEETINDLRKNLHSFPIFFLEPTLQELNLIIVNVIYTPLNVSFTPEIFMTHFMYSFPFASSNELKHAVFTPKFN